MTTTSKALAEPDKYPVTLKRFLILTLPKLYNKRQRRVAAWREFRKSGYGEACHFSLGLPSCGWRTLQSFADWLSEGNAIPNEGYYRYLADCFCAWYVDWRAAKTSGVRSKAAYKRHKKTGARPNRVAFKNAVKERLLT